jgi:hypothetical protein
MHCGRIIWAQIVRDRVWAQIMRDRIPVSPEHVVPDAQRMAAN